MFVMFMKKIKSLISVILALCVILTCSVAVNAASASVSASANKTNVTAGDTVTVSVNLNSSSGIAGIDFILTFNSAHLEYQNCTVGSAGEAFTTMKAVNRNGSTVKGAFLNFDGTATTKTGALATVTFKVIATTNASSPISLSSTATDGNANSVSVSVSGTTLNIAAKAAATTTTTKPVVTTTKPVVTTTKPAPTTTKPETTIEAETTTEGEKVLQTETIAVQKGNAYQLAKPSAMTGKVKYTSSKTSVATVTDSGVINTLSKGMTTITAVSENGVTKTWLLIVGDGSTVETTTEEETEETSVNLLTELETSVLEEPEEITEEATTAETENEKKDSGDKTFRLVFGTGAAVAVIVVIVIIASMIRKRKSFV